MSAGHSHGPIRAAHEKPLWIALALTTLFLVAEVIGGLLTSSLALLSDAAHMFTDAAALAISLIATRFALKARDRKRTFGYYRLEILAAAFNASLLFLVAIYILYEAYVRLRTPEPIQSTGMLGIAVLGLVVNLISMQLLRKGSGESLNVKGAYLEVWSDMLGSLGVIVAALVIRLTGWLWVDPVIAALIGLWVLPRTWILLKASLNILLEGVPEGMDMQAVERTILETPGVVGVHDLHVWALTAGKPSLTAHLNVDSAADPQTVVHAVCARLDQSHHITHTTLQCEFGPCPNPAEGFHRDAHGEPKRQDC